MGWRGLARSVAASARRAERARDRRDRLIEKAHSKAGSFVARLDAEVEKEIEKATKWEAKLEEAPVKTLKLAFDNDSGKWSTAPFEDNTGIITFSLSLGVSSVVGIAFNPPTIELDGIVLKPLSIVISQYFTAVALSASPLPGQGGRILKLVNKATPENSRIAICSSNGENYLPTDSSIDGRLFPDTTKVGVATFESFTDELEAFDIILVPKGNGEPVKIKVTGSLINKEIKDALSTPSLLETFISGVREKQSETASEVNNAAQKAIAQAKSGCLVLIGVLGGICGATVLAAWLLIFLAFILLGK